MTNDTLDLFYEYDSQLYDIPTGHPTGQPNGQPLGQPNGWPISWPHGQHIGWPNGQPIAQPDGWPCGWPKWQVDESKTHQQLSQKTLRQVMRSINARTGQV